MTTQQTTFEAELSALMVEVLNLDVAAGNVDPESPLYGEGLGLDSIDMLEISLAIAKRYGVELRADDEANVRVFASLRSLAAHVERQRAR
ncbi:MAG: phosphopantetheine-binding protein [Burkholderiales bacterium]|nr:phosphopantetheine-binding protein [Burkholderiales bacterium]